MIIMNWRMNAICHRLGRCSRAGSTLSLGMLICEMSYKKSFNKIYVNNKNKNVNKSDVSA